MKLSITQGNQPLIIVGALILYSCVNVHRPFNLYRREMTEIPNTKGFYYQKIRRKELPLVFFFYEDGTVLTSNGGGTKNSTSDPAQIINEFRHQMTYRFKGELKKEMVNIPLDKQSGHYFIKNDSVRIQYFYEFVDYWVKRNVIELNGTMQNDSIMILKKMRVYGAKKKHSSKIRNSAEVALNPPAEFEIDKEPYNKNAT